ncbi:MAG: ATP-dependent Clp protease adapter ClpS, partial [Myxococcota bacterium]
QEGATHAVGGLQQATHASADIATKGLYLDGGVEETPTMASKKAPQGPDRGREGGTQTLERTKQETQRPKLYRVVMHNDDYTTQEFVVFVLMHFFRKDATEATALMLHVHTKGRAIVGLYTKDLAETKCEQVLDYAREQGHPLLLTVEPDE